MRFTLQAGDRIAGKYRVLRALGSGGMGAVYLAQHERLDRQVAIKVMHRYTEDSHLAMARFEREIKALSSIVSPYVAAALDADILEDGSLYLVMEYLEGRDLRAERKLRQSIPYPEAAAYLIQACAGVATAHDIGIIHRDLKPHNLFLTHLNAARTVKVLDFGVAKFLATADITLTATDVAVGTPLYMSPEQLCSPKDVSTRSDVWALGVVLYELIAGVSPFAAETPGAVIAAVTLEDPVTLDKVVPEVPAGLAETVANALRKSPTERIGSARELAEHLTPYAMPEHAIVVASVPSQRPVRMLERSSSNAALSERVRHEVSAFDKATLRPGRLSDDVDAIRQLPNLERLSIPLTKAEVRRSPHGQIPIELKSIDGDSKVVISILPTPPPQSLLSDGVLARVPQQTSDAATPSASGSRRSMSWAIAATFAAAVALVGALTGNWHGRLRSTGNSDGVATRAAVPAIAPGLPPNSAASSGLSTVKEASMAETTAPVVEPAPTPPVRRKSTILPKSGNASAQPLRPATPPTTPIAPDGKPLHL